MDEKQKIVALLQILKIDVRREVQVSAAGDFTREVSVARLPETHKIRPVNERHARSRGEENLAALLCRLLQPSLADQRLEALDDRVQLGPVGKDVVGEGFRETANFDKADVFGHGEVQSLVCAAAFASAHVWCDFLVDVRGHGCDARVVGSFWDRVADC